MIKFPKRKYGIVILLLSIICIIEILDLISSGPDGFSKSRFVAQHAQYLFYWVQSGFSTDGIGFAIAFLYPLTIPFIFSISAIKTRLNHFDYQIYPREKNAISYWVQVIRTNFVLTFVAFLVVQIIRILTITVFYGNMWQLKTTFGDDYLFKNGYLNLFFFIVLACIGQAVFSTLVLVIGLYLKNYVAYMIMGLLTMLLFSVAPLMLVVFVHGANIFVTSFNLQTLLKPSLNPVANGYVFNQCVIWLISFVFYSAICAVLFWNRMRLDRKGN